MTDNKDQIHWKLSEPFCPKDSSQLDFAIDVGEEKTEFH